MMTAAPPGGEKTEKRKIKKGKIKSN